MVYNCFYMLLDLFSQYSGVDCCMYIWTWLDVILV